MVMNKLTLVTAALVVLGGGQVSPQRLTWTFDETPPGRPPHGFVFSDPTTGPPAAWLVVRDGSNAVLAPAPRTRGGAALAIAEGAAPINVTVSARLRFPEAAGTAGVAWRFRDPQHYYAIALDLRAQNVRLYRVVGGNRTRLENEDDLELDPGAWHTVKVEDSGMRMRVWIDGVPVAEARDRSSPEPGAVGFWTATDAAVLFDDLHVEPLGERPRRARPD
jgi:hypothetical protein